MKYRREINFYYAAMGLKDALILFGNIFRLMIFPSTIKQKRWEEKFSAIFQKLTGTLKVITFGSARSGLYYLLKAMGIGPGDEVLITGFTCLAVPNPIIYLGAKPVYVDIDICTFNMDSAKIEENISDKSKAIIIQHTFGNPADMDKVIEIARKNNLYIVEDCCLALGSTYRNKPIGSRGDASIFSFELSKTITTGWGGAVCINNQELIQKIEGFTLERPCLSIRKSMQRSLQVALSYFLYHPLIYAFGKYIISRLFKMGLFRHSTQKEEYETRIPDDYFCAMPDVHWRVAFNQLRKLPEIISQNKKVSRTYAQVLINNGIKNVYSADTNWIRYPILIKNRANIIKYFADYGIEVGQWFNGVIHPFPENYKKYNYSSEICPNAEFVSKHIINLPVHIRISKNDIKKTAVLLNRYFQNNPADRIFANNIAEGKHA